MNIIEGTTDFGALEGGDTIAVDLVARMVRCNPAARLKISQVVDHPFFWSDMHRIEKVRGWKTSWRRGRDLDRRLGAHAGSVRSTCTCSLGGSGGRGWLSALDKEVADRLSAWEDGSYDGKNVLDLVRAIRNVYMYEHWFEVGRAELPADAMLALVAVTGWDEAEMRKGRASTEAQGMQAAAVSRYFLGEHRFAALLLVFEFSKAWSSD